MENFSALLVICAGNSPVTGEFPSQRPVTRSFDVFFDLRLNKRLSKQTQGWWFETPSGSLWRHCNVIAYSLVITFTAAGYCIAKVEGILDFESPLASYVYLNDDIGCFEGILRKIYLLYRDRTVVCVYWLYWVAVENIMYLNDGYMDVFCSCIEWEWKYTWDRIWSVPSYNNNNVDNNDHSRAYRTTYHNNNTNNNYTRTNNNYPRTDNYPRTNNRYYNSTRNLGTIHRTWR